MAAGAGGVDVGMAVAHSSRTAPVVVHSHATAVVARARAACDAYVRVALNLRATDGGADALVGMAGRASADDRTSTPAPPDLNATAAADFSAGHDDHCGADPVVPTSVVRTLAGVVGEAAS